MYILSKDFIIQKNNLIHIMINFKARYNLDWMSLHYGEDYVDNHSYHYFHSGPKDVVVEQVRLVIFILKRKISIPIPANVFKNDINKKINLDAKSRKY